MSREESRRPPRCEPLPQQLENRSDEQCYARRQEKSRNDIARPMRAEIDLEYATAAVTKK